MNEPRPLRKVVSDVSSEIEKYKAIECSMVEGQSVQQAECECCGLKEDCTADYITRVKDCYFGKWVCGLCSEAVKESLCRSGPKTTMQDAVSFHREFCQRFNTTTRLNPKLSLTSAMRDIAKRSHENRSSNKLSAPKIARSISCVPKIDLKR